MIAKPKRISGSFGLRFSAGMGLVEILVALTLSVTVVAGLIHVFINAKQYSKTQDALIRMEESGRHAMQVLTSDIRAARYLGQTQQYWSVTEASSPNAPAASISNECFTTAGAAFRWIDPFAKSVDVDGNAATPTILAPTVFGVNDGNGVFSGCIFAGDMVANTDVVSLHYASATMVPSASLLSGAYYIRSDLTHAVVFRCGTSGSCAPAGAWDAETDGIAVLNANVYWIRSCTDPGGDSRCSTSDDGDQPNVPALVKTYLSAAGTIVTDVIADSVVNMQVQYGVDVDNSGLAERYENANDIGVITSTSTWATWNRAKTLRVWLLVRSPATDTNYQSATSYSMGDHKGAQAITVTAGYRYQLFTSTVALRNFNG